MGVGPRIKSFMSKSRHTGPVAQRSPGQGLSARVRMTPEDEFDLLKRLWSLNAQLRDESIQRLMLHSVMLRRNPGDILSDLVDAHLRQFRVQANPTTKAMSSESASPDVQANDSEAVAA